MSADALLSYPPCRRPHRLPPLHAKGLLSPRPARRQIRRGDSDNGTRRPSRGRLRHLGRPPPRKPALRRLLRRLRLSCAAPRQANRGDATPPPRQGWRRLTARRFEEERLRLFPNVERPPGLPAHSESNRSLRAQSLLSRRVSVDEPRRRFHRPVVGRVLVRLSQYPPSSSALTSFSAASSDREPASRASRHILIARSTSGFSIASSPALFALASSGQQVVAAIRSAIARSAPSRIPIAGSSSPNASATRPTSRTRAQRSFALRANSSRNKIAGLRGPPLRSGRRFASVQRRLSDGLFSVTEGNTLT
jgi:hypothetical protein